jgi:hypothetical protein
MHTGALRMGETDLFITNIFAYPIQLAEWDRSRKVGKSWGIISPLPVRTGSGLMILGADQSRRLIRQETVTGAAHIDQVGGIVLIRLNGLANVVDVPLG